MVHFASIPPALGSSVISFPLGAEAMSEIISIWGRVSEFVCDNIKQLQATGFSPLLFLVYYLDAGVASPALGMAGLCMQFHLLTSRKSPTILVSILMSSLLQ